MSSGLVPRVELRHPVVRETRCELGLYDRHRDTREQHERAQRLALAGRSEVDSAVVMQVCDRTVHRMRHRETPSDYRPPLPAPTVSDERIAELEGGAELVLHLAFLLRDEDPNLVWGTLSRLSRQKLQELMLVALAAVPIDATRGELFAWVEGIAEAI